MEHYSSSFSKIRIFTTILIIESLVTAYFRLNTIKTSVFFEFFSGMDNQRITFLINEDPSTIRSAMFNILAETSNKVSLFHTQDTGNNNITTEAFEEFKNLKNADVIFTSYNITNLSTEFTVPLETTDKLYNVYFQNKELHKKYNQKYLGHE